MKKQIKLLTLLFVFITGVCCFANVGLASNSRITMEQDGFEAMLETDKEHYAKDDQIKVDIQVTNKNENFSGMMYMEIITPEFLDLSQGTCFEGEVIDGIETFNYSGVFSYDYIYYDEENPPIPQTSDINYGVVIGVILMTMFIFGVSIIIIKNKYKKRNTRLLSIVLSIVLLTSVIPVFSVAAQQELKKDNFDLIKPITIDGQKHNIIVNIEYEEDDSANDEEIDKLQRQSWLEAGYSHFAKFKIGQINTNLTDLRYPAITEVIVDYELKYGFAEVEINPIPNDIVVTTVGAVGIPVNIDLLGGDDELVSANITFKYDKENLGTVKEDNLKIAWYDEQQERMVLLEESIIDKENSTVSVNTSHFSKYIVIDSEQWYNSWNRTQLIIRDEDINFNLAFAIDSSGSMSGDKLNTSKTATLEFIKRILENDMISVIGFNNTAYSVVEPIRKSDINEETLYSQISSINASGGTNIEAALWKAENDTSKMKNQRMYDGEDITLNSSFIVLLSDGNSTVNNEVLAHLKENNIKVISVALGNDADLSLMERIAKETNGKYIYAQSAEDVIVVYEQIRGEFIGLTEDDDNDGIPSLIESSGMRNQYGETEKTDPNDPDTDGDGISDGEEMGEFISDGIAPYFMMRSHPTIPSTYVNKAKLTNLHIKPIHSRNIALNSLEYCYNYMGQISYDEVHIDMAWDFLHEYVYDKPVNIMTKFEHLPKCMSIIDHDINSGRFRVMCNQGGIKCNNEHNLSITLYADNAEVISTKVVINFMELWKAVVNEVINDNIQKLCKTSEEFGNSYLSQNYIKDILKKSDTKYLEENILIAGTGNNELKNEIKKLIAREFAGYNEFNPTTNPSKLIREVFNFLGMGSDELKVKVDGIVYNVTITTWVKNKAWYINCSGRGMNYQYYAQSSDLEAHISDFLSASKKLLDLHIEETKREIASGIISESIKGFIKPVVFELITTKKPGRELKRQNRELYNKIKDSFKCISYMHDIYFLNVNPSDKDVDKIAQLFSKYFKLYDKL